MKRATLSKEEQDRRFLVYERKQDMIRVRYYMLRAVRALRLSHKEPQRADYYRREVRSAIYSAWASAAKARGLGYRFQEGFEYRHCACPNCGSGPIEECPGAVCWRCGFAITPRPDVLE